MKIIDIEISKLCPYENNPRNNDEAVPYVAKSIEQFGFKVPIVIDKDYVIVCGHTRVKAATELGMEKVPCVVADDLTDEQIREFRIVDNKVGELSNWDRVALQFELDKIEGIDMNDFGFANVETMDFEFEEPAESVSTPKVYECPHCGERFKKDGE